MVAPMLRRRSSSRRSSRRRREDGPIRTGRRWSAWAGSARPACGVTAANVERLIRRARESAARTKVVVSFIEQPENTAEIPDFERHWRGAGAHQVVVRRLHTNANSTSRLGELLKDRPAPARRPCLYPWERILLTPTGQLAFCPQDWVHASALADYHITTIREVWRGETYRRLREAHLANNFCQHKFCGQCPDWATTRWPGEGLSYADLVENVGAAGS